MASAIRPPVIAVATKAPSVSAGPIQAPTPASSFTSPAPIPPIAYSGNSRASPNAAPPSDHSRAELPPDHAANASPPITK